MPTFYIEYFDGSHWTLGPNFPFKIHTENAQCILDRMGRVIILSNDDGLIIFNTTNYDDEDEDDNLDEMEE